MAFCTPERENWLTRPPGAPGAPAVLEVVLLVTMIFVLYGVVYSTFLEVMQAGGDWLVCSGSLEAAGPPAWTQGACCEGLHHGRLVVGYLAAGVFGARPGAAFSWLTPPEGSALWFASHSRSGARQPFSRVACCAGGALWLLATWTGARRWIRLLVSPLRTSRAAY